MNEEPTKNEMMAGLTGLDLATLRRHCEEIAGQWNGDESGTQEDAATCANEIIEKIDGMLPLLEELGNY